MFARIENEKIKEVSYLDMEGKDGWVESPSLVCIGFSYIGGIFKPPYVDYVKDQNWDVVRKARNKALSECDYIELPSYTAADKADWLSYRQALRDMPQTYSNLEKPEGHPDFSFPDKPGTSIG